MPFFGTGGLGERVWSGPAITVTGIDAQPVDRALNAVVPFARAKLSLRIHPSRTRRGQAALLRHSGAAPVRRSPSRSGGRDGKGFAAKTSGRRTTRRAPHWRAPGGAAALVATGGSIPLVSALSEAVPDAEILLLGTTDGFANIHAPNERVLLDEFEKAVVAEAEFFGR